LPFIVAKGDLIGLEYQGMSKAGFAALVGVTRKAGSDGTATGSRREIRDMQR
jgi:hypothetical protein